MICTESRTWKNFTSKQQRRTGCRTAKQTCETLLLPPFAPHAQQARPVARARPAAEAAMQCGFSSALSAAACGQTSPRSRKTGGGFRYWPINFVTGHCCGPHLQVANSGPCNSRCLVPVAISKATRKGNGKFLTPNLPSKLESRRTSAGAQAVSREAKQDSPRTRKGQEADGQ